MKRVTISAYFVLTLLAIGVSFPSTTYAAYGTESPTGCEKCDDQCGGQYGEVDVNSPAFKACAAQCKCP